MIVALLFACAEERDVVPSDDLRDLADDDVVCAGLFAPDPGTPPAVVLVGVDSAVRVELVDPDGDQPYHEVDGLAVLGDHVAFCAPRLTRVELATGLVETADVRCDGLADVDGGVAVLHRVAGGVWSDPIRWYPSWEDVVTDTDGVTVPASPYASRLGRGDAQLLAAWHSTDEILRADPVSGATLPPVELRGYDTWVWGLSAVGDRLFVVNDGRDPGRGWNTRIAEFDPSGRAVQNLRFGQHTSMHGLACVSTDDLVDDAVASASTTGGGGTSGTSTTGGGGTSGTVVVGR